MTSLYPYHTLDGFGPNLKNTAFVGEDLEFRVALSICRAYEIVGLLGGDYMGFTIVVVPIVKNSLPENSPLLAGQERVAWSRVQSLR